MQLNNEKHPVQKQKTNPSRKFGIRSQRTILQTSVLKTLWQNDDNNNVRIERKFTFVSFYFFSRNNTYKWKRLK